MHPAQSQQKEELSDAIYILTVGIDLITYSQSSLESLNVSCIAPRKKCGLYHAAIEWVCAAYGGDKNLLSIQWLLS